LPAQFVSRIEPLQRDFRALKATSSAASTEVERLRGEVGTLHEEVARLLAELESDSSDEARLRGSHLTSHGLTLHELTSNLRLLFGTLCWLLPLCSAGTASRLMLIYLRGRASHGRGRTTKITLRQTVGWGSPTLARCAEGVAGWALAARARG
jgi:hypothetical protein